MEVSVQAAAAASNRAGSAFCGALEAVVTFVVAMVTSRDGARGVGWLLGVSEVGVGRGGRRLVLKHKERETRQSVSGCHHHHYSISRSVSPEVRASSLPHWKPLENRI